MTWQGDSYQKRFDELAASGQDVHGEATFVRAYAPSSVLDAGCGTGRVAIELAFHGVEVVGADRDASMLATAAQRSPQLRWERSELGALEVGRTFDVVVLAGNVPLFTDPGTEDVLVAGCARHVAPAGRLIAGFQLGRGYDVATYDAHVAACGLVLEDRFASWERAAWPGDGTYAVSVHRRPVVEGSRDRVVFHLTSRAEAAAISRHGAHQPAAFADEGFVHASNLAQVPRVGLERFSGRDDVVALVVHVGRLGDVALVDEPGDPDSAERFPHIYGPIPASAVLEVAELAPVPGSGATGEDAAAWRESALGVLRAAAERHGADPTGPMAAD